MVLNSGLEEEGEHGGEQLAAWEGRREERVGVAAPSSHWLGSRCSAVLEEATRGQQIPETGVRAVSTLCMLGSKPGSSERAVSAFNG